MSLQELELRQRALDSLAASYGLEPEEIELILEWFGSPAFICMIDRQEPIDSLLSYRSAPWDKLLEIAVKMEFGGEIF